MEEKFILSIDQGTTSTRAILINKLGQVVNMAQEEVFCNFPHSGWVETDALNIWVSVISVVNEVLIRQNITWDSIDSIGITNQRETSVIWDKKSGMPVCPAIVWQSRQSSEICDRFESKREFIHKKTGLLIKWCKMDIFALSIMTLSLKILMGLVNGALMKLKLLKI